MRIWFVGFRVLGFGLWVLGFGIGALHIGPGYGFGLPISVFEFGSGV